MKLALTMELIWTDMYWAQLYPLPQLFFEKVGTNF